MSYQVLSIAEQLPGISDQQVLQLAQQHGALLLTEDKDFGELVHRRGEASNGVLLIRVHGLSPEKKSNLVTIAVQKNENELLQAFSVLTEHTLRIRHL